MKDPPLHLHMVLPEYQTERGTVCLQRYSDRVVTKWVDWYKNEVACTIIYQENPGKAIETLAMAFAEGGKVSYEIIKQIAKELGSGNAFPREQIERRYNPKLRLGYDIEVPSWEEWKQIQEVKELQTIEAKRRIFDILT